MPCGRLSPQSGYVLAVVASLERAHAFPPESSLKAGSGLEEVSLPSFRDWGAGVELGREGGKTL